MLGTPEEAGRLTAPALEAIRGCRRKLGDIQVGYIEAFAQARRFLSHLPSGQMQLALGKLLQQRFQPTDSPLREMINLSAELEALVKGGSVKEIELRMVRRMLSVMSEQTDLPLLVIQDDYWSFSQESDPSLATAKAKMQSVLDRYGQDETKPPDE